MTTGIFSRFSKADHTLRSLPPQNEKRVAVSPKPTPEPAKTPKKSLLNGLLHPMIGTGDGLGEGLTDALERRLASQEFNQHVKAFLNNALLSEASEDIYKLNALLNKAQVSPEAMTDREIAALTRLVDTLRQSTTLSAVERQMLKALHDRVDFSEVRDVSGTGEIAGLIRNSLKNHSRIVWNCENALTGVIKREQGSLVAAVEFLNKALLDPKKGMLKAANIQLTTAQDSILKNALRVVNQAFLGQGGMLPNALVKAKVAVNEVVQTTKNTYLGEVLPVTLKAGTEFVHTSLVQADKFVDTSLAKAKDTANELVHTSLVQADKFVDTSLAKAKDTANEFVHTSLVQADKFVGTSLVKAKDTANELVHNSLVQADKFVGTSLDKAKNTGNEFVHTSLVQADKFVDTSLAKAKDTGNEFVHTSLVQADKFVDTSLVKAKDTGNEFVHTSLVQADKFVDTSLVKANEFVDTSLAKVVGEHGALPEALKILSNHLKQKSHPLLLQLQETVKQCKEALAQNKDSNTLAQSALDLIQQIKVNRNTVLPQLDEHHADFIELEAVEAYLQENLEGNPFEDPAHPLTPDRLGRMEKFIQRLCSEQQNVVAQAADILRETLEPAAINWPGLIVKNFAKAIKEELGILDSPAADGAAKGKAVGGLLDSIGGGIKQMFSKGISAISKEALGAFTSLVVSFIQKIEAKIDPKFNQKALLQALIFDVENQKKTDGITLESLQGFYDRLVKILDTMNITVSGFYLPHSGDDSDEEGLEPTTDAYENVEILNSAHDDATAPAVKQDYESLSMDETNSFIDNTIRYLEVKWVFESVRHKQPNRAAYLALMQRAKQLNAPSLEKLVYEDIKNDKNIAWYSCWWQTVCAWFVFKIAHSILAPIIKRAGSGYLKEAFDQIKLQKQRHFEDFTNKRIDDANNYLSILNAAFESLPKVETAYGDAKTMIKREMENPLRNHFYTVDQIYDEFAQNVIEKGIGNRTIAWIFGKMLRNKRTWVKTAIDEMMSTTQDANGYSHALNTVIVEFLEKVEQSMKKAAREKGTKPVAAPMSKERKRDLADLLKNLFNVLDKTAGKKEIHNLFDVLKKKLEEVFHINIDNMVIDQVLDNSTTVLADAIDMLAQEDQLQMMTYKFVKNLNQSYAVGAADASPEEKLSTENRVHELATNILRESISQAIDERADLTKEQGEVNAAIESLRVLVNTWCERAAPEFQALESMDASELNSLEARTKIGTLHAEMKKFQTELKLMKGRITNNPWKAEVNKEAVLKGIKGVEQASNALVQMIKSVERREFLLERHAGFIPELRTLLEITNVEALPPVETRLHQLKGIEPFFTNDQVVTNLRSLMKSSEEEPEESVEALIHDLRQQFANLARALHDMESISAQRTFLRGLFDGEASWIHQILDAKRTRPATIRASFETIKNQITLNLPEDKRRLFIDALTGLIKTKAGSVEETQQREACLALCSKTLEEANTAYDACSMQANAASQLISSNVDKTKLLDPSYVITQSQEIGSDLEDGENDVKEFQQKCQEILTEIPFANIDLIPAKTFKRHAKAIVFDATKRYTDELLQFIARPETVPAALRHMVLMPYNRYEKEKRLGHPIDYDDHAPAYKAVN